MIQRASLSGSKLVHSDTERYGEERAIVKSFDSAPLKERTLKIRIRRADDEDRAKEKLEKSALFKFIKQADDSSAGTIDDSVTEKPPGGLAFNIKKKGVSRFEKNKLAKKVERRK